MSRQLTWFRILLGASVFAIIGACIDFWYEWPVRVPGDPPSSPYTYRHAVGVNHGWISYSTDDIFAYDDLKSGFGLSAHPPVIRIPFGYAGWMDFGVCGVAPWFLAACGAPLVWSWNGFHRRTSRTEQEAGGYRR